jgi:hypothetical protein
MDTDRISSFVAAADAGSDLGLSEVDGGAGSTQFTLNSSSPANSREPELCTTRMAVLLPLLVVAAVEHSVFAGFRARLPARLGFRSGTPVLVAASTDGAAAEAALLRQAALTDRGLRASALDKSQLQMLIRRLESLAPDASALDLNGEWRLALALGETPYRSSPFFWAFRQAAAGATTPVAVPGAEVAAGDSLASAIYGVTDTLPFYDIGNVVQRISGLCSDVDGCKIEEEDDEGNDRMLNKGAAMSVLMQLLLRKKQHLQNKEMAAAAGGTAASGAE